MTQRKIESFFATALSQSSEETGTEVGKLTTATCKRHLALFCMRTIKLAASSKLSVFVLHFNKP
jgi:hypothetical protein